MTVKQQSHVRWMIRIDLAEVMEIDRYHFTESWTEEDFVRCLRQRNVIGLVAEDSEGVLRGFMLYELHKSRIEIIRIAVSHHRYGLALVDKIKSKLSSVRRHKIAIDVPEVLLDTQLAFRDMGFVAVEIKESLGETFYRMEYKHG